MQEFESTPLVLSRDGYPLDDSVAAKVLEFMWTTVEEAFKYSNTHKDSIPAESSLLDFFRERVERTGFSAEEKEECLELCRLWGSYIGDGVERQSLRFFGLEECLDESVFYFYFFFFFLLLVVVGNGLADRQEVHALCLRLTSASWSIFPRRRYDTLRSDITSQW